VSELLLKTGKIPSNKYKGESVQALGLRACTGRDL
jgi:hypothetical protein